MRIPIQYWGSSRTLLAHVAVDVPQDLSKSKVIVSLPEQIREGTAVVGLTEHVAPIGARGLHVQSIDSGIQDGCKTCIGLARDHRLGLNGVLDWLAVSSIVGDACCHLVHTL